MTITKKEREEIKDKVDVEVKEIHGKPFVVKVYPEMGKRPKNYGKLR